MKLFYKRDHQKAKYSSMIMLFEKSWTPSLHSLLIIILSPFNSAYCSPSRYFWPFTCFPPFGWCLPTLLLLNFMCWAGRWKPPWCQQYGPIKLEVFHQQTTQSWTVDPKVKKGSSPGLLCVACLLNPKTPLLEHKHYCNTWKMSKIGQNVMKNGCFLPFSCYEWQVMGPKEVFYSYLVPEMIW